MKGTRRPPDFYPAESFWTIAAGFFAISLGLVFLVGPLFFEKRGVVDLLLCVGIAFMDLLMFALGILLISKGVSNYNKKRKWLKTATLTSASIVRCEQEDVWDQNYMDMTRWVLDVVMKVDLAPGNPVSILAGVYISEKQYKRYINRKATKIYYSREDPFEFLLEDEV